MGMRLTMMLYILLASCFSVNVLYAEIEVDLTHIGAIGNASDDTGLGSVNHAYSIGTYEVTVGQ